MSIGTVDVKGNTKYWLLLITVGAFIIRLPYWEVIPASFDEVNQTVYALLIAQRKMLPLVGNDAYAGPFYYYLVAGLLRSGITDPMVGRMVVMVTGTLTVPATYGWVYGLSQQKVAGLFAAAFIALNPDLILINSHIGGSTFLLPFFTTLFLMGLVYAVRRDSYGWLIAGACAAGLALQANPVAGLPLMAGLLWLLWQTRRLSRLGKWWPLWPVCAGLIIVLIYSPVIVYNLNTELRTVAVLQERSYLWEDNPTVATTLNNMRRLALQTGRQVSGVLQGKEQFTNLVGVPLLYLALMGVGLTYTSYHVSTLPLFILVPFFILFPIASSHYGFSSVGRFTTLLIPVWAAPIGVLLAELLRRVQQAATPRQRVYGAAASGLGLILLVYPVVALFQYYEATNAAHESGRDLLELSRYAVEHNQGEPVYISPIEELSYLTGVPYVPHAAFLLGDIHHEFLPPQQIIGRLYERPGAAFLLLSHRDAATLQNTVPLERIPIPANEEAALRNYGLYRVAADVSLPKPDFVLTATALPENLSPPMRLGEGIELLGCETPQLSPSGNELVLTCYLARIDTMPQEEYVGFMHLLDPNNMTLVAQDDHILGQQKYPVLAWQPGEIIREQYSLNIVNREIAGTYQLLTGIYTWPNLIRLSVPGNGDNVVVLPHIDIPVSR